MVAERRYVLRSQTGGSSLPIRGFPCRLGRDPSANVHLRDLKVSREHCTIREDEGGRFELEDHSARGTRIEGRLIRHARAQLQPGQRVEIGAASYVFELDTFPMESSTDKTALPLNGDGEPDDEASRRLGGTSAVMRQVRDRVRRYARSAEPVLILGETGTGKEEGARALHALSQRKGRFVALDCASVAAGVAESELFGHERGAFTGADQVRAGAFEEAHGGTLFLDEVGELPLALQAKLLRVLQEREVRRVGGKQAVAVDVRIVAATNRDLRAEAGRGAFREDLFHRLYALPLELPPLRARMDDLAALARTYAARSGASITDAAIERLRGHGFAGNVRELINIVRRAAVEADGGPIAPRHVFIAPLANSGGAPPALGSGLKLDEAERAHVVRALADARGVIAEAARRLGISRQSLYRLIDKHDVPRP